MQDGEEGSNVKFFKRKAAVRGVTTLSILVVALAFYFTTDQKNFISDLLLEIAIIIPMMLFSSILTYVLDVNYRKVETSPLIYFRNSLYYLVIAMPFWLMSIAIILSYGRTFPVLLFLNAILLVTMGSTVANVRVRVWKRMSKDIENKKVVEEAMGIAGKMGIDISGFKVVDWSKAKIANAFQAGLLHYYVFVTNYLLENLTEEEDVAILAHEIAHAKMKHLKKTLIVVGIALLLIGNSAFSLIVFTMGLGVKLGLVASIVLSIFMPGYAILPYLQRRFEREADIVAAKFTDPVLLAESLLKISRLNHSPINFPRHWNLSHPSTSERVAYLTDMKGSKAKLGE